MYIKTTAFVALLILALTACSGDSPTALEGGVPVDTGAGSILVYQGDCSGVDVTALEASWAVFRSFPDVVALGLSSFPAGSLAMECAVDPYRGDLKVHGIYYPSLIVYREASPHVTQHEAKHWVCIEAGLPVDCSCVGHGTYNLLGEGECIPTEPGT